MKRRSVITNRLLVPKVVIMSSKGQMTLPIVFRRFYDIRPGTKIAIEVKGDAMIIIPSHSIDEQLAKEKAEEARCT